MQIFYRYCCLVFSLTLFLKSNAQPGPPPVISGRLINFSPSSFSNKFSLNTEPVLRIHTGDTVQTETIDAGGFDKNGVRRQHPGNPLTGPFYIEEAKAGDVLAVTLTKVSLNRAHAFTTESFVSRSLPAAITKQFKKTRLIRWNLDIKNGFASPDTGYGQLQNFKVPLHPFLGCIGVAPAGSNNESLSFFSGPFGGNMDFSGVTQYATIYLPILHDGGFLYIGDGHALQGDGELAGNALETSMDVTFTVQLIKNASAHLSCPRVEDPIYIMAVGLHKHLDMALKAATQGLLDWLQQDYLLSLQQATQVMSTGVEYTIAEIADRETAIVAKIKKQLLAGFKK